MAAELKSAFDIEAELIVGGGGVFDVKVDGQLVFSKKEQGNRFPNEGEVVDLIKTEED